jgi:hypothetical protein
MSTRDIRDKETQYSTDGVQTPTYSVGYLNAQNRVSLRLLRTDERTFHSNQLPAFLALPSQIGGIFTFIALAYSIWFVQTSPDVETKFSPPGWGALIKCATWCGSLAGMSKLHGAPGSEPDANKSSLHDVV